MAEGCGEILRGARWHAVRGLGDEGAIGVIRVAGATRRQDAAQRVVAGRLAAIAKQVARRVVAPAIHLVGGSIAQVLGVRAIHPDTRAVARQI